MYIVKKAVSKIGSIEKTVSLINASVTSLQDKVKTIDNRVHVIEQSCEFMNNEHEKNRAELKEAKQTI